MISMILVLPSGDDTNLGDVPEVRVGLPVKADKVLIRSQLLVVPRTFVPIGANTRKVVSLIVNDSDALVPLHAIFLNNFEADSSNLFLCQACDSLVLITRLLSTIKDF